MIFLLLLLAVPCLASGPKYNFQDPKMNDEFQNVYHDISVAAKKPLLNYTKAQIGQAVPGYLGQPFYCSDCTIPVCVSTGIARGAITSPISRTTVCN